MMKKIVCLFLALTAGVVLSPGQTSQATPSPDEYLVKAAFLYNFAKFVEWPADAFVDDHSPITLCILGQDPFGEALDSIKNKTIRGRELMIKQHANIENLESCHMLFISQSEKNNLSRIFEKINGWNVLTLGDMENFTQDGGIINLITRENKIRFEININAAQHSNLKISSQLLKLAIIVKEH